VARFALFLHASDRGTAPERRFDEMADEAAMAESVGFDGCMIAEHHQSPDGHYPAPLMLAAGIAARTKRIRVGSSVLLAPLYHPVHLAEESATVDLISSGRLILGMGIGYSDRDFDPFGVPQKERATRMEDCVAFLKRAWTEDDVTFEGRHFRFEGLSIHPKPVQRPRPPIWLGGDVPAALRRAARLGDGWIGFPFYDLETLQARAGAYRAAAAEFGTRPTVVLRRDGWVAEDRATAIADYQPAIRSFQRFMNELDSDDPWFRDMQERKIGEETTSDRLILGSPEDCVRALRRYIDGAGVEWFIMRFRQPDGPAHDKVMKAIELFGRAVIPHVRDEGPIGPLVHPLAPA